jgi:integrase
MARKDISKVEPKPTKPYPDFPLFPHATKRWAKKIRGKFQFFGPWSDPQGALQKYLDQRDDLHAGRTPRAVRAGLTLRELVNHYLTAKHRKVEAGELKLWSFNAIHRTSARLIEHFGPNRLVDDITPTEFGQLRAWFAKALGPLALGDRIQRTRSLFKYGYETGLIATPVRFGPEFAKPSMKNVRLARRSVGERMYSADEIKKMLKIASPALKAMILLGINCGMGNTDVAELTMGAVDLKRGFLNYPRPKTGIDRRAPLWKETVAALKAAIKVRPAPKHDDHGDLVFITKYGNPWIQVTIPKRMRCAKCQSIFPKPAGDQERPRCPKCRAVVLQRATRASMTDSVANEFEKLLDAVGIDRPGRGFYWLRHTFRTVADDVGDRPAIDKIMGHENAADMRSAYVEKIADTRLQRVTNHTHSWLFRAGSSHRRLPRPG